MKSHPSHYIAVLKYPPVNPEDEKSRLKRYKDILTSLILYNEDTRHDTNCQAGDIFYVKTTSNTNNLFWDVLNEVLSELLTNDGVTSEQRERIQAIKQVSGKNIGGAAHLVLGKEMYIGKKTADGLLRTKVVQSMITPERLADPKNITVPGGKEGYTNLRSRGVMAGRIPIESLDKGKATVSGKKTIALFESIIDGTIDTAHVPPSIK